MDPFRDEPLVLYSRPLHRLKPQTIADELPKLAHPSSSCYVRARPKSVTRPGVLGSPLGKKENHGGMQTWLWAEQHPDFADGFVPMASQPSAMASRNWMMRRLMVETIRHDPTYADGNYTAVPHSLPYAIASFNVGTFGGNLGWLAQAPTPSQADAIVARLLASPPADANDWVFQWDSSHDYDAAPDLQRITRPVLVINSADDERNPPESGIVERAVDRLPHGEYDLVPESSETRGHGTVFMAKFYAARLGQFLASLPSANARPLKWTGSEPATARTSPAADR
jgi:pimeloyl-ACP methyl ester carboxylesterase